MTPFPICQNCSRDLMMENDRWESGICKACDPPKRRVGNPMRDEYAPNIEDVAFIPRDNSVCSYD